MVLDTCTRSAGSALLGAALILAAAAVRADDAAPEAPGMAAPVLAEPAAPSPSTSPPPRPPAAPAWGFLVRGGYFGLPDLIADMLFEEHPKVEGSFFGAEFRYHGTDGPRGVASFGICVDHGSTEARGFWRTDENDPGFSGGGSIEFTAVTLTGYWNVLPSLFLHPYVGLGIGAGYYDGFYRKDEDLVRVDSWLPVVSVPLGLAVELGKHANLAAEARFINGFSVGGVLQVLF